MAAVTVLCFCLFQRAAITPFTSESLIWSYFHFRPFQRIGVAFPCAPDDALPARRLTPGDVYPIQVAVETFVKPPTTSIALGTVTAAPAVLVSVRGREPMTTKIDPRVTGMPNTIT